MMKKLSVSVTALSAAMLLMFASVFMAFAATAVLDDSAAVFSSEQQADLTSMMNAACDKTGWQFIIHTSNDGVSSDDMVSHYDSYYSSHGYENNAIMLVIDMGTNNRQILSYGEVKDYFKSDSSRYDDIKSAMKSYLNNGDMYGASKVFIQKAQDVYAMGKTNKLVLVLKKYGVIIGLVSIAVGVIMFFVVKSKYKNMGKSGTYDLSANSSVDLREAQDDYVTQHTTVRTIQRESNDSSSSSSDGHSSGTF